MIKHSPALIEITSALHEALESLGVPAAMLEEYEESLPDTIRVFQGGLNGKEYETHVLGTYLNDDWLRALMASDSFANAILHLRLIFIPALTLNYKHLISLTTSLHGDYVEMEDDPEKTKLFVVFCLLHELGHFKFGPSTEGLSFADSTMIERSCDAGALFAMYKHSVPGLPNFYADIVKMRAVAAVMDNFVKDFIGRGTHQYKYSHALYLNDVGLADSVEEVVEAHKRVYQLLKQNRPADNFLPIKRPLFYSIYLAAYKTLAHGEISPLDEKIINLFMEGVAHFAPESAKVLDRCGMRYVADPSPIPPLPEPVEP